MFLKVISKYLPMRSLNQTNLMEDVYRVVKLLSSWMILIDFDLISQLTLFLRRSSNLSCFCSLLLTIHLQSRPQPKSLLAIQSSVRFGRDDPNCSGSVVRKLFSRFNTLKFLSRKIRLSNVFIFALLIWK